MTLLRIGNLLEKSHYLLEPLVFVVPGSYPGQNIFSPEGERVAILWLSQPPKLETLEAIPDPLLRNLLEAGVELYS